LNDDRLLTKTLGLASEYLASLERRRVGAKSDVVELRRSLGGSLPEQGLAPERVIQELASGAEGGLVASAGPRYFGLVIGGSLPAALAADWLASAWDQNAGLYSTSPAAAVVEEVAATWLLDLFDLPRLASVGFVTGCQMANFTCLAAARHAVLAKVGWDVEAEGLRGAPPIHLVVGDDSHATIGRALRMLGLGSRAVCSVGVDSQGRMLPSELSRVLARCEGPTIVCAQSGNVNTGAFDPLDDIVPIAHDKAAWLHVDGAFGLWAAASPKTRHLAAGLSSADSWATDAHKWLNVPYDCGIAIVADPLSHRAAFSVKAAYLLHGEGKRDGVDFVPEASRRARGFAVYAALRSLGRRGVAELVERCCALASRMASRLKDASGVQVLNEVVLNQVLVGFSPPPGADADGFTRRVIARLQQDGTCWLGGTRWHNLEAMRISVSNWSTTEQDIDASAQAIVRAVSEVSISG